MSEEQDKRKQAEALVDAVNRRDFETIAELTDPELEFGSVIAEVEGQTYIGLEGMRKWAQDSDATWATHRIQILEFHEVDDERAVVVFRVTGSAKESGVPLDVRTGQAWTYRGGKVWRIDSWTDPSKALEAAGLSE